MADTDQQPASVSASLRRLTNSFASTLQNRAELVSVELQEEKCWLVGTLLWAGASVAFGFLSLIVVTVTIVSLSPVSWRPYELVGFSLLYIIGFISAISGLKRLLRDRPLPLSGTIAELKKDVEWIQSRD